MEVFLTIYKDDDKSSGIRIRKDASKDITVGSSPFCDIILENESIKDEHLSIIKLNNGRVRENFIAKICRKPIFNNLSFSTS
jgi:hypothetical protein